MRRRATRSPCRRASFPNAPTHDRCAPRRARTHPCAEEEEEEEDGDKKSKKKGRGNVDSGKGVRLQGGRVYDSKFGITCHWCRQKTLEEHVTCTHPNCGKGKRLATTFW